METIIVRKKTETDTEREIKATEERACHRVKKVNESLCCRLCEPGGTTGGTTGGPLLRFGVSSSSMSLIVRPKTNNPIRLATPGSRAWSLRQGRLALTDLTA